MQLDAELKQYLAWHGRHLACTLAGLNRRRLVELGEGEWTAMLDEIRTATIGFLAVEAPELLTPAQRALMGQPPGGQA